MSSPYRDENGDLAEIVTDYDYRDDGTLEQVTYTHGDDDITVGVTLDDHGRLKTMGELTFDYEPDDSIDTVQTVFTDGAEETVLVDRRYDDKGRFTGLSVQLDGVQVNNYSWHYHEHDGRLETVARGEAGHKSPSPRLRTPPIAPKWIGNGDKGSALGGDDGRFPRDPQAAMQRIRFQSRLVQPTPFRSRVV